MNNNLILLHDSYVSDYMLNAAQIEGIPIFAMGGLHDKLKQQGYNVISERDVAKRLADLNTIPYFNAEDCLTTVFKYSRNNELITAVNFFKNKYEFKKGLVKEYPDHFIARVTFDELPEFDVPEGKDLIIKPSIGFHSVGIRSFRGKKEWKKVRTEVINAIKRYKNVFDVNVLNNEIFLIEDYLSGDELACDAYFNHNSQPIVLSISQHPFANKEDRRDLVYWTSAQLIQEKLPLFNNFLQLLASKKSLKNIAIHFEVRIKDDVIYPIEVNPLRFGGFGLASLPQHAFGINSYEHFFKQTAPDWDSVFSKTNNEYFAFIVAQTPSRFDSQKDTIDEETFKKSFEHIIKYIPIDTSRYKFFSTTFAKTTDLSEFTKYLSYDFDSLKR